MTESPIYIIENNVYRFEQIIVDNDSRPNHTVELFNAFLDRSVFIYIEDKSDIEWDINNAIKTQNYTLVQW